MNPRGSAPEADDRYLVETPERIALEYDVAGLGSRLLAAMADTALLTALVLLIAVFGFIGLAAIVGFLIGLTGVDPVGESMGTWILAAVVLLEFAVVWGYYLFFDLIWHGQSPGKRRAGLRVIKEGGYPIGFVDSAIRNLVRVVDFLPSLYGIGAIVMLIDRRSRRLGDLAAGTLVVKERGDLRLESLLVEPLRQPDMDAPAGGDSSHGEVAAKLDLLTSTDHSLLREYLSRRATMAAPAAADLAAHLAAAFARKLGHDLSGEPPERFLARLAGHLFGSHGDAGPLVEKLDRLTPADHALLRDYLTRRSILEGTAASALADHLASVFARRLGHDLSGEPPERFLARLAGHLPDPPGDATPPAG